MPQARSLVEKMFQRRCSKCGVSCFNDWAISINFACCHIFDRLQLPRRLFDSRNVKFSKRGITQQQLDADWSARRRENTVAMSFAEAYTEPKRPTSYAEEYLLNGCMAAKGYTVTW